MDNPEAFGQHSNADITSLITEARTLCETLMSLQLQSSGAESETKEDKVKISINYFRRKDRESVRVGEFLISLTLITIAHALFTRTDSGLLLHMQLLYLFKL